MYISKVFQKFVGAKSINFQKLSSGTKYFQKLHIDIQNFQKLCRGNGPPSPQGKSALNLYVHVSNFIRPKKIKYNHDSVLA